MSNVRELAYRVDPALWVRKILDVEPQEWQEDFLRAPRGASGLNSIMEFNETRSSALRESLLPPIKILLTIWA